MPNIVVRSEKVIARPVDVVAAQFADMPHHQQARVHKALEFETPEPSAGGWRFTTRRRVFGAVQEDHNELTRAGNESVTIRVVSGANTGLVIRQTFEPVGSDKTLVRAELDLPVKGVFRLLAPLLRAGIARDFAAALEEDRVDLEERGYGVR